MPAAQDPPPVACTAAILRVELGDLAGLADTRLGRALPPMFAALFEGGPRDGILATFEAITAVARTLPAPLTVDLHGVRNAQFGTAVTLDLPAGTAPLGEILRTLWKDEPSTPVAVQDGATDLTGAAMQHRHGTTYWLDGTWLGRRTVLVLSGVEAGPQAWIAGLAAARERARTSRLDALAAALGPGPARLRVDFAAVLRALPRENAAGLQVMTTLLGARFAGVVATARPDGDRVVCECLVDVGRDTGLLGRLVRDPVRVPPILARVPADAEFAVCDLDTEGVGALVRLAKTFAGDADVPFDEILAILDEHWDGQLATVTLPSSLDQALDPDAEEPFVVLLGSPDGFRARLLALPLLAAAGVELEKAGGGVDRGPDEAWPLRSEGETMLHLGAQQDFIALLGADAESVALFTKIVATRGKGGVDVAMLPAPLRGGCSIVARSSPLSDLSGQVAQRALRGRDAGPFSERKLAELIEKVLGREPTFAGARVEATTTRVWTWN